MPEEKVEEKKGAGETRDTPSSGVNKDEGVTDVELTWKLKVIEYDNFNDNVVVLNGAAYDDYLESNYVTKWYEDRGDKGYFRYILYKTSIGMYIERVWKLSPAGPWQKRIVYMVLLPTIR